MAEQTLHERLFAACHAVANDTEGEHPFSAALEAVLTAHEPLPPVGPYPSPMPGICGRCGGTGVVHGPGQNGNWTDQDCDCDDPYCGECGQVEPCGTKRAIAAALGMEVDRG